MGVQAFVIFCGYQAVSTTCRSIYYSYYSRPIAILAAENYDARRIYVQHCLESGEGYLYRIRDLLRIPISTPP